MNKDINTIGVIAVLIFVLLSLFGCVNYYTRWFKLDDVPTNDKSTISFIGKEGFYCNRYFVYPSVFAFRNSIGSKYSVNDLENYHKFDVSVEVYDIDATDTIGIRSVILECFKLQKVFISVSGRVVDSFELNNYRLVRTFPQYPPIGISFYFGSNYISPSVDSLALLVPLNYNEICRKPSDTSIGDTLVFNMHRIDNKKRGLYTP